jgi:putative membrane protein
MGCTCASSVTVQFLETLLRRWYVVAFVFGYFAASVPERGWKSSFRFALIAFGVAFAAEYSSTHNGFPFTHYSYTGDTKGDETYLANVPLFVPMSYAVMIYAGRSIATFLARSKVALVALGAIATTAIDLVVDPPALRGSQWFLGDVYHYASHGPWFGVPIGNFAGWILTAGVILALDQALAGNEPIVPARRGILLTAGVVAFNIAVAFAIGATLVGFASLVVVGIMALGLFARTPEVVS